MMDVLMSLNHDGKLSEFLYKSYAAKTLIDVEVITSDLSTFYAHRIVLSAFSEYFRSKIKSKKDVAHTKLQIDIDSAIFKVLLEFMYTGQLSVTTDDRISLYHASVVLEMESAQELLQQAYMTSDWPGQLKSMMDQVDVQDDHSPLDDETQIEPSDVTSLDTSFVSKATKSTSAPKKETEKRRRGRKSGSVPSKKKSKTQEKTNVRKLNEDLENEEENKDDPDFIPDTEVPKKIRIMTRRQSKTRKMVEMESEKERKGSKKAKMPKKKKSVRVAKRHTSLKKEKAGGKVEKTEIVKSVRKVYVPRGSIKCYCGICQKSLKTLPALKKHLALKHKRIPSEFYQSRIILKKVIHHSFVRKLLERDHFDDQNNPNIEENMTKEQRSKGHMKCKICDKMFSHYSTLVKHVREQHVTVLRMDKNGLYYKLEKHLKMKMKLFETKKGSSNGKQGERKNLNKKVSVECYLCHIKISKGRNYANHLKNVHGHDFGKAREITGYPKYKMMSNKEANANCPECRLTFTGAKALKSHLKKVHNLDDFSYSCPECHNTYSSLSAIKSHLRWIHGKDFTQIKETIGQILHCEAENCEFSTGNMLTMKMHVMKMHPGIQYKCSECGFTFHVRAMLNRHMIVKHLRREEHMRQKCNICGKCFSKSNHLIVHQYTRHGIKHDSLKLFQCSFEGCGKLCISSSSLKSHERRHSKEKNFECPYCHLKLKTEITYRKHVNKMHLGIRPHLCQICGQRFGEDSELQSHIKNRHSTEKEFQCTECPYATANKSTFYTHMFMVHKIRAQDDNRKEYKCPHCNFSTVLGHRYKTHLNGHKNIREYTCSMCGKQFISSSTLRAHKQWAHSEKKYTCNQCGYQTKTTQKLNEHIRVQHQLKGFKPYRCPYCSFTCATGGNTRKHIKQKHKGLEVRYIRDDSLLEAARLARRSGNTMSLNFIPVMQDTLMQEVQPGFELQNFQITPPMVNPSDSNVLSSSVTQTESLQTNDIHTLTNVVPSHSITANPLHGNMLQPIDIPTGDMHDRMSHTSMQSFVPMMSAINTSIQNL